MCRCPVSSQRQSELAPSTTLSATVEPALLAHHAFEQLELGVVRPAVLPLAVLVLDSSFLTAAMRCLSMR
jgi:hypothetical protein